MATECAQTGVVLLQMFIYFTRYRRCVDMDRLNNRGYSVTYAGVCRARDSTWLKSLVAFSVTISFLSAVLAFTVVYTRSVVLFGQC